MNEVFLSGQWLKAHMKHCKGLKVEAVKEKPAASHTKGASSSFSSSKKMKHQTKSQQSDSQLDSQTLLPASFQASSHMILCHSRRNKKKTATTTPKKSHSGRKDSGKKCSLSHQHSNKKHKVHKSDKHPKKKK